MATNILIDKKWLTELLEKIQNKAGPRYTPELNIDLPISEIFDGISRTKIFYSTWRSHLGELIREFGYVGIKPGKDDVSKAYQTLQKEIFEFANLVEPIKEYDTKPIPWRRIERITTKAIELCWDLSSKLRDKKGKLEKTKADDNQKENTNHQPSQDFDSYIHYVFQTQKELRYFEELSLSTKARLANKPFLLLTGNAGTGKTHLLCDLVADRLLIDKPVPAVLVFGEYFVDNKDVFEQIIDQIGLKVSTSQFLQLLDQAGKKRQSRALLIIDAVNETRIKDFWKKNLGKIISEVKRYPNVGLIISLRSGFEPENLTKKIEGHFVKEEHIGFQFREWEAVNKFFRGFELPLPEIPLLTPEFQNPLFLLLFCKAFQSRKMGRGTSKEIFRGHEGATYIFESFVDSVSKRVIKQLGIRKVASTSIWDGVIEKIAEEMVNINDESISETKLGSIVKTAFPSLDVSSFIQELERNFLIVKVPGYSLERKEYDGFNYRFPFQKFSDHLIGRYLFKKYEAEFGKANKNLRTAKTFFSKRRKLGKYLFNSWNRGVVEALSIQCPEHLKGVEFIDTAPYLRQKSIASEAFIESLIWRKPNAFTPDRKNTLDYINSEIIRTKGGHDDLLNAFLAVAPVPDHPFNADFLHKHLSKFSMPDRDQWWSTFLHYQYGSQNSVDRLVEWSWSIEDKTYLTDESVRLCSVVLAWFLTTPNRFLRDRTTKALISLVTGHLKVMVDVLEKFHDVNDPYVLERLYAVAYGVALRTRQDREGLKFLATWICENVFKNGDPPPHILLRDYARGVIHVALDEGIDLKVIKEKINPPFRSAWPKRIPSEKTLRKEYYPEDFFKDKTKDRGFLDIWSSVMHDFGSLGDFGNYIMNPAIHNWSARRLQSNDVNRSLLLERFKAQLTKKQKVLFEKATNPFYGVNFSKILDSIKTVYSDSSEDEKESDQENDNLQRKMNERLLKFENSLVSRQRSLFKREIKPYLDGGKIVDPLERFDTKLAQRWLFNRVVDLGWNYKQHGEFDTSLNHYRYDRSEHKPERIGKKYQWIAFHELLARIADNFELTEDRWSQRSTEFVGSWQVGPRDIDPSCILKELPNVPPADLPSFGRYRKTKLYDAWSKGASNSDWLKAKNDLPNPRSIIEITDSNNNQWLVLQGFVEWQEETPPEQKKYDVPTRTLWCIIKSYLLKNKDIEKTLKWAKKQSFMGRWMPESHEFYDIYLGEYPWSPAFLSHYVPYYTYQEWTNKADRDIKLPTKVLVTADEYVSSGSSLDCSTDENIRVRLPAKYIVDEMHLKQPFVDGRFFDTKGELVVFDPSLFFSNMPGLLLIRKDKISEYVNSKGYSIMWTLLGEKNLIGGGGIGQPFGWLEINGAYTLRSNMVSGSLRATFLKSRT